MGRGIVMKRFFTLVLSFLVFMSFVAVTSAAQDVSVSAQNDPTASIKQQEQELLRLEQNLQQAEQDEQKELQELHNIYVMVILLDELQFNNEKVVETAQKGLVQFPNDFLFVIPLGNALSNLSRYEEADKVFKDFIAANTARNYAPELLPVLKAYRVVLLQQHRDKEAAEIKCQMRKINKAR
jgi:tetratricopeptide (TPR) repeat protein